MKLRIWKKKLNLFKYLQQLDTESLAQKIFNEQERLNFPGLIKECEDIAHEMNIQTELKTMDRKFFKKFINEKMIKYNEKISQARISAAPCN